jgi:hypothetical protein
MPRQSATKAYQPQGKRLPQTLDEENAKLLAQENTKPPVKGKTKSSIPPSQNPQNMWRGRIIIAVVLILIVAGSWYVLSSKLSAPSTPSDNANIIASNNAQTATHSLLNSNVEATASALPTLNWQTAQTFTGHDTNEAMQNTQKFTVPAKWQLNWSCQGKNGVDDQLTVAVYNVDGSLYDAGAQITCLAVQKIVGSVIESKTSAGTVYLGISSNTDWTVTVRAPK